MHDDVTGEHFWETQRVYVLVLQLFLMLFPCSVCILLSVFKNNFRDLWLGILDNFQKIEKNKSMIVSINVPACDIAITTWQVHNAESAPFDNCT